MRSDQHTAVGDSNSMVTVTADPSVREPTGDDTVARGTAVGRYIVLGIAGHGGMGVVYRAYDPELQREVALKLLRGRGANKQAAAEARLRREAQAMARVSHPNVLPVYDVGAFDGRVWLAMEFLAAETLSDWLERERRSPADIIAMFVQAGRGLAAAHAVGLIHRDFKPQNVLVGNDGRARVMDFGLARVAAAETDVPSDEMPGLVDDFDTQLTAAGSVVGTPRYMAPEQHYAQPMDARADQFSFCVALYEALYHVRAFAGDNLPELAKRKHSGELAEVTADVDVPARVLAALKRGMAGKPDDRFETMDALLTELAPAPPRTRGRSLLVTAIATASIAGAAAVAIFATHDRPCSDADRKLVGVWDAERREAVAEAMRATGQAYAEDTLAAVESSLDRYASAWVEAHDAACAATRVYGEQSPALLDLRVACFDRLRAEMRALVDVLAEADTGVLQRAIRATDGLREVSDCDGNAELIAVVPPPADATAIETIAEIEAEVAKGRALDSAGKAADAVVVLEPAVAQARRLGWRPLEADALAAFADAIGDAGDAERERVLSIEALSLALAGRATRTAAEITVSLLFVDGYMRQDVTSAKAWAELGRGLIEAIGGEERLSIALHNGEAIALVMEGDLVGGQRLLDEMLQRQRAREPEGPRLAVLLGNAGALLATRGQYGPARRYLAEAEVAYRRSFGEQHPDLLSLLSNLGAIELFEGHYEAAIDRLDDVAQRQRAVLGSDHPEYGNTLNNLANANRLAGHVDVAIAVHRQALALRERKPGPNSLVVAQTLDNLSIALRSRNDIAEARKVHDRATEIRKRLVAPDHTEMAVNWLNEAEQAAAEHDVEAALGAYAKALEIRERKLGNTHPQTIAVLSSRGDTLLAAGRRAEAIADLERALAAAIAGGGSVRQLAALRFDLAQALEDPARARRLALEARDEYATYRDDGPAVAERIAEIDAWLAARTPATQPSPRTR
ncbi:MAG: serine/threonine-protein kinase [Nannocystaceae bacterium]|nr:serine/threonine-protein kinase [Nannocystaceae bacterium]